MDREKLTDELTLDEGKKLKVYRDSLGILSVGIGHMILPGDMIPEGSEISEERCMELFNHDLEHAIRYANIMFGDLETYPELIQEVLVNLMFNLGPTRLGKFKHFVAAIKNRDYIAAGNELEDSTWYKQVGPRADRLIAMVDSCADEGMA